MSTFTIDELVDIAGKSRWKSGRSAVVEEYYDGTFKLGKDEKLNLVSSRHFSNGQEIYRLIVMYSNDLEEVIYGDDAKKVLEIAKDRLTTAAKYWHWMAERGAAGMLRALKRDMKRYEKNEQR